MRDSNTVIIVGCVVSVVIVIGVVVFVISIKRSCAEKRPTKSNQGKSQQQTREQQLTSNQNVQTVSVTVEDENNPNQCPPTYYAVPFTVLPESFDFNSSNVKIMDDHVLVRSLSFLDKTHKEEYMKQESYNPNYVSK